MKSILHVEFTRLEKNILRKVGNYPNWYLEFTYKIFRYVGNLEAKIDLPFAFKI